MSETERSRLLAERDAADKRFGLELTRVDRSLPAVAERPVPVAVDIDVARLRAQLGALPSPPDATGWRGRLARFVWRLVAPRFEHQSRVNTALVDVLDATADAVRRIASAVPAGGAVERDTLRTFLTFHSALITCLQQIPPFVDTKARALEGALDEVRMAAVAAQRTALAAQRQIDLEVAAVTPEAPSPVAASPGAGEGRRAGSSSTAATPRFGSGYVGFEDLFRGSETAIRARQADYVSRLAGCGRVVDIGCGRGELLSLLREAGVEAVGVDANPEMVATCRARGLQVVQGDGVEYVASLPSGSVGAVTALQVVEHLAPERLVGLLQDAYRALRPGGALVLETINVACWVAYFESYMRDITHVRPLHPDTLKFLVVSAGFADVDVEFRSPVDADARLQTVDAARLPAGFADLAQAMNRNVERLNERLFTSLDYAVIARRL